MELRLNDRQTAVRMAARRFAIKEIGPAVERMEAFDEFPEALIRQMARKRLLGIPIAKEWGGAGADFISYIAAIHEISKVSAAAGVIVSVHTSVATLPILQYGTDDQRRRFATKLAAGEWLGAFALTEPQAGSDAAAIRTSAVREGGGYRLNGSKIFITNAGAANLYVVFAVTDPAKGAKGITAFIVKKETPGFRIGRKEKKMGLHGSNTCELLFDNMAIPESQRLGEEGQGFEIAKGSLDGGRIGIAAQALGIADAALQTAKRYLLPRRSAVRSSAPGPLPVRLAELTAEAEAARMLVYRAAWMRQEGAPCTAEASMAKMFASDAAVKIAGEAVSMLGPEGCAQELAAERFFRDAKVTQIYEGTNEIHRLVIGNRLLNR